MNFIGSIRPRSLAAALALAMVLPALHAAPAGAMHYKVDNLATGHGYDRFIVTYRDGTRERVTPDIAVQGLRQAAMRAVPTAAVQGRTAATPLGVDFKRRLATGASLVRTSRKLSGNQLQAFIKQVADDPAVAYVQADVMMHAVRDIASSKGVQPQAFTPDDPQYAQYQWHFSNAIGGANVPAAWDLADGSGVTVAVLDTGITQHPDLDLSLADAGYDFISDAFVSGRDADGRVAGGWDLGDWTTTEPYTSQCTDSSSPPEASSWHGTHVSGTIAELTDNGVGMAGIAHKAQVLPVRVLGHCGGYTSDIADGIVWASGGHVDGVPDNTHPAQVINMSLGGTGACSEDDVTGQAIAGAISRGTTVVVAAGNSAADVSGFSPASCPGVIAVGSNGITGKRAFYSNFGAGVTIAAPGGGVYPDDGSSGTPANPDGFVWSSINAGQTVPGDATYGGMAGTSQATPHVAGTVALVIGAVAAAGLPTLDPGQVKSLLVSTARRFPVSIDKPIGAGIVNAAAAVNKALGNDDGGGDETAVPLARGAILGGQAGGTGASLLFSIDVPEGARNLNLRTFGGNGDVSLYVAPDAAPSADGAGATVSSTKPGNSEAVLVPAPTPGTWYVRVVGAQAFANVSVMATYTAPQ